MGTVKENYMGRKIVRELTMTHGNKCTDLHIECFSYYKVTGIKEKPGLNLDGAGQGGAWRGMERQPFAALSLAPSPRFEACFGYIITRWN